MIGRHLKRWLIYFFTTAGFVLLALVVICFRYRIWSTRDFETYRIIVKDYDLGSELWFGGIARGDQIETVIAKSAPHRTEQFGRYELLAYFPGGPPQSNSFVAFTSLQLVAKDGKLVAAYAGSCTWSHQFFDMNEYEEAEYEIAFKEWIAARRAAIPQAPNLSKPIAQRGMPVRVHVFEDYETDIEKRWWLAGKVVTENLPPSLSGSVPNRRACRATEAKDFDRANGDQTKLYKAVIFNPVPGPPMGPRTRLSFRYWLKGADELRVQIYSLSKNYHRFLTLKDLKEGEWQLATVDMTQARKPDGTGGPLAEDERIDDIQFYIDRAADLLIDDIVLYEEAAADEKRPFPRRIIFTGWFDTGQQGKEWPGDFAIVKHEKPRTWKAAKAVPTSDDKEMWIRLHLRGLRHLSKTCEVRLRYHVTGAEQMRLVLVNTKMKRENAAELKGLKQGGWAEATVAIPLGEENFADELRFLLPRRAELMIDDVLIYEPGR